MIDKKERRKILNDFKSTNYCKALKEYVIERLIVLNDINNSEDYEDYKAKKEAKKVLKEIFRFLNITEANIREQTRNQYE